MSVARAVLLPCVVTPRDPGTVCLRYYLSPHEFFETVLTPEEADELSLDLRIDVRRAKAYRRSLRK